MTRLRWIVASVSLLVAWTVLIGWYAAHWGGTYARGRLPDPIRETIEDPSRPWVPDVRLVAFESRDLDEPDEDFSPSYTTRMGTFRDEQVNVRTSKLDDGGLQLSIDNARGFAYQATKIDLLRGPGSEVLARVEVHEYWDSGPHDENWEKPSGWILVGRRDWSDLSPEHPLYVKFHLVDGATSYGPCVQGFVRVPQ